jgi:hypothetical protein
VLAPITGTRRERMIVYCRRCDLGFCERHADQHDGDDHEIGDAPEGIVGCCVCLGIYQPRPKAQDA